MDMQQENAIWEFKEYDREQARRLQQELDCPPLTAALLIQRGVAGLEEARAFLNPSLDALVDPMLINGVAAAAARIRQAVKRQERVVIYGDYDVDGICSIVILKECLADLGLCADYYIPDRFTEGYGLNQQAVEELAEEGYSLMITVDCGITAVDETAYAMEHGLEVIITDHHMPREAMPAALAVINTKLDSIEAVKDLSGAATAFKLVQALAHENIGASRVNQWLDLVALATVADIVPLKGENRILVKYGLEQMRQTVHTGIRCLLEELELNGVVLDSWHLGFLVAPKLNSAGRLDTARRSVELLLSGDPAQARPVARMLCDLNRERRLIEESMVAEAMDMIERDFNLNEHNVLIVGREGWHQGVVGIVASRLVERYNRPAVVISWEDELGKGSARSTGEFDMHGALASCQEFLVSFGGHRMAAGLHVEKKRLEQFRDAMNDYAATQENTVPFMKKYRIDMELAGADLGMTALADIQRLKPFGEGNPGPQFVIKGAWISDAALVGRGQEHLRFRLEPGRHAAIAFNLAPRMQLPYQLCKQDFLFRLEENNFNGSSLQLKMRDIKCSCQPDDPHLEKVRPGHARLLQEFRQTVQSLHSRQPVIYVYPALRALQKHRPVINHYFRESQQVELHGVMDAESRRIAEGVMSRQAPRLFLTTEAYWSRLKANVPQPGGRPRIVYWWPQADDWREKWSGAEETVAMPVFKDGTSVEWQSGRSERDCLQLKMVYYANRTATVRKLPDGLPAVFQEAGVKPALARREARRDFERSERGWLVTDGSQTPGHEYLNGAQALYLADCPFGLYELDAMMPDNGLKQSLPAIKGYSAPAVAANLHFLAGMYPGPEILEKCWRHIIGQPYNRLENTASAWLQAFGHSAERQMRKWELRPILQVLTERGLLKYHLQGNIITIIIEDRQNAVYTDAKTPLQEEGQGETACFQHWLDTALKKE